MDFSKFTDNDLKAISAGDMGSVSTEGLQLLAADATPAGGKNIPESFIAGVGTGFGRTILGAQGLVGKGLGGIGLETIGGWLERDAAAGRENLLKELAPYSRDNPFTAGAGKLAGEVAATLPVGGLLAKGVSAVPVVGGTALAPLANALATAGGRAGGLTGAGGLATKVLGGGIVGGTGAAMIDPDMVGVGTAIGAAIPIVGAGVSKLLQPPKQSAEVVEAVKSALGHGYVIPPTQVDATLLNKALEGFSGKLTTAQNASLKNQEVTNKLAARSLGLPDDAIISTDVLNNIRRVAGESYAKVANTGVIKPTAAYKDALNKIAEPYIIASKGFPSADKSPVIGLVRSLKSSSFDAASAVEKIKHLRTAADDAFRAGNTDVGRASRSAANIIEAEVGEHLQKIGATDLLKEFQSGRRLIAKTFSIEKALNQTTGNVNAGQLAAQLAKGKPMSDELLDVARFSQRFKTATKTPESMGSLPQTSPLDWGVAAVTSATTGSALPVAGVLARPAARSLALSPLVQNRLVQDPNDINQLLQLLRTSTPATVSGLYSD